MVSIANICSTSKKKMSKKKKVPALTDTLRNEPAYLSASYLNIFLKKEINQ